MHSSACLHFAPNSSVFGLLIQCHLKVNGDFNARTCLGILDFHACITQEAFAGFLLSSIFFMNEPAGRQPGHRICSRS